jgi:ribosomal-protein-alanine N-acetyltransferase
VLISTHSLVLRPLDQSDRDVYVQLYTDATVMRYIGVSLKAEVASASFDKALALQDSQSVLAPRWVLLDAGIDQKCGLLGLFADHDGRAAEIGLMLLPSAQGRGLAGDAIGAMVAQVFAKIWVRSVWARHAPGNHAMAAVLRSRGFHMEAETEAECRWRLASSA